MTSKTRKKHETPSEGKTDNKTKFLIIALAITVLLVMFLFTKSVEKNTSSNTTTTTKLSATAITAKEGDVVEIDYVGKYLNGTVFDTSMEDVAKNSGIYNSMRSYKPIVLTIGLNEVIQGVEEAIVGMEVGQQKKDVVIKPENGYGEWSPDNIEEIPRVQNTSRVENISLSLFENVTGEKAVAGRTVEVPEMLWPITILDTKEDMVSIRHNPENGTMVPTLFGNASLLVTDDRIYAKLEVKPGDKLITQLGYVKVMNVSDTMVTLDVNHELAGQTIIFDLKLVSINQVGDPYADQMQQAQGQLY